MYLNYRGISRVTAMFLMVLGAAMIPSVVVGLIYKEMNMALCFFAIGVFLYAVGKIMFKVIKPSFVPLKLRDGFLIVAWCWLLSGLLGALPYMLSGYAGGLVNSIFESFSGFTTTGATIFDNVEILPKSLLFWRSFSQWVGGFGIVFVPIALLPALGFEGQVIVRAEMSGTVVNKVNPRLSDSARTMFLYLSILTLSETLLLMFGGLDLFDALTHSFTTMSTGGFTNYNDNLGHFASNYIYCIFSLFMFIAGMDVTLQASFFRGEFKKVFKDIEFRFYIMLFAIATTLVTGFLLLTHSIEGFGSCLTKSAFHVLTALSTSGFFSADFDYWPLFSKLILLTLMLVGGCISSTSGGIKCFRAMMFLKMIKRGILIRLHPNAIIDIKAGQRKIPSETLQSVTSFILLYLAIIAAGIAIISFGGFDVITSLMASIACIGNVGPALSLGGTVLHYGLFSAPIKLWLCFMMLAGRLELMTIIILFSSHFWNPDKSK